MGTDDPSGLAQLAELGSIRDLTHDSREVRPGDVFVALRGANVDGHDLVVEAVAAGAAAVVVERAVDVDVPQVLVDDTRRRIGALAAAVHRWPSRSLTTVGITGTNGKTTTAQLVAAILDATGADTGVIGTLHGPRTTPEAPELQRRLRGFVDDGRRAAVLEVSSHALALHRVDGTRFDAVAFTNLGRDHLDLHGSEEDYFRAKARLFTPEFSTLGVVNVDDPHGRLLADTAATGGFRVVEVTASALERVEVAAAAHRYRWRGRDVVVPLGGRFNVTNSHLALVVAAELGIDTAAAVDALTGVAVVPGRFEVVSEPGAAVTVVVDYAHTPDGLAEVLHAARAVAGAGAVTVVFGCGGDRDRPKRPEMGAVAASLADTVVVTSDNPRRESPQAIIDDILAGVDAEYRRRVVINPDRSAAIEDAVVAAGAGDVVVVAGKGHEPVQEFADHTIPFDDREVARAALGQRR